MPNEITYTIVKDVPLPPIQISDIVAFVQVSVSAVEQDQRADNSWQLGYVAAMDDVLQQLG